MRQCEHWGFAIQFRSAPKSQVRNAIFKIDNIKGFLSGNIGGCHSTQMQRDQNKAISLQPTMFWCPPKKTTPRNLTFEFMSCSDTTLRCICHNFVRKSSSDESYLVMKVFLFTYSRNEDFLAEEFVHLNQGFHVQSGRLDIVNHT